MLQRIDMNKVVDKVAYDQQLEPLQEQLQALGHDLYECRRTTVIVFEGWDAAGKGGAIRRLTQEVDARGYEVYPIAAPAGEDKTHHYLWRFWRRLKPPEEKQIQIFDRSWYGRVLVERVEGFCGEPEWKRAYREINEFERQMVDSGMILIKFWLHTTQDEQLRRFEERQNTPAKSWKLTDEDWRNREKWPLYEAAVTDMLMKTSTIHAPWTVVEANDKYYARLKVLRTVVDTVTHDLGVKLPGKKKKK